MLKLCRSHYVAVPICNQINTDNKLNKYIYIFLICRLQIRRVQFFLIGATTVGCTSQIDLF